MAVPEIMPLETLHNALTLCHFDKFLDNAIRMGTISPKRSLSNLAASQNENIGELSHQSIHPFIHPSIHP